MSLGSFFGRVGDNIGNAPSASWFSLAQALSAAPGNRPLQGLAQGISAFGQTAQSERKKASLAEALKGAMVDFTPQQKSFFGALGPDNVETIVPIVANKLFSTAKANEAPNDVQEYEYAVKQGFKGSFLDFQTSLRKSGASNTTINNIPAEVGARIGLGEGFLSNYDDIKKRANEYGGASGTEGVKRRGQMFFNTGEGGRLWRDVESGKDALIRGLTGSGMASAEAEKYVSRYSLTAADTQFDMQTKLEGLKRDLENVAKGVYKARGGEYKPPAGGDDHSDVDAILGIK